MLTIGIILIIFMTIFDYYIYKTVFSPVFMFNSLFLLIISLSSMRLYNLREYSIKSIEVIVLGMIFFSLGVFCTRIVSHEFLKNQNNVINYDDNLNVNWTFLKILLIVVTTGNVFSIIFSLKFLLGGGSYLELRNMILGYNGAEPLITNPLVNILTRYISGPGLTALIPFSIFFLIRKKNIKFSLIILLNLVLATLSSGGRILLVYTIIQLFIGLSYSKKNIPKKIKKVVIISSIIFFISIIVLSNIRSSSSIYRSFYGYFSGPVVLLSTWMTDVDTYNIHSHGLGFIYPITYLLNSFCNLIGIPNSMLANVVMWQGMPQNDWVGVFPNQSMNAFSTLFYFFYKDFREFGVACFSFLFGSICGFIYFKAFIERKSKYLVYYLLGVQAIIGSFIIWQLGSTAFFLSIVFTILSLKSKKS